MVVDSQGPAEPRIRVASADFAGVFRDTSDAPLLLRHLCAALTRPSHHRHKQRLTWLLEELESGVLDWIRNRHYPVQGTWQHFLRLRRLARPNTLEVCARSINSPLANLFLTFLPDEIGALILDPGSHSTRAGFAGEDTPKSVVPTSYGVLPTGERLFGDNAIHLPRADMEIKNPYNSDGIVEDWETAAKLWEYTITSRLTGERQTPASKNGLNDTKDENGDTNMDEGMEQAGEQEKILQEFPLLMSEPAWNPAKERQKTIEIAMEDWGVPAFFLAKTGQLAAYVVLRTITWRTLTDRQTTGTHKAKQRLSWLTLEH